VTQVQSTSQPFVINVSVLVDPALVAGHGTSVQAPTPVAAAPIVLDHALHRVNLHAFLVGQVGKFVGIDFIKGDGSVRALNGRLGVRKHLKGGSNTVAADERPYLVIYDVKSKGYRAVNLATASIVRAQHKRHVIVG
jgi:hypothetical protein